MKILNILTRLKPIRNLAVSVPCLTCCIASIANILTRVKPARNLAVPVPCLTGGGGGGGGTSGLP